MEIQDARVTPTDIITLGQSLYGDPWLERMAADLEYSTSQLCAWSMTARPSPIE